MKEQKKRLDAPFMEIIRLDADDILVYSTETPVSSFYLVELPEGTFVVDESSPEMPMISLH